MENDMQLEILHEMAQLLDTMAVESFIPVREPVSNVLHPEAMLINLKSLNAKYDKQEAMAHVHALMSKYNIQIDELVEQLKI
jgi:hypothetical protein